MQTLMQVASEEKTSTWYLADDCELNVTYSCYLLLCILLCIYHAYQFILMRWFTHLDLVKFRNGESCYQSSCPSHK